MGLLEPKDEEGFTAFDYGKQIIHELRNVRDSVEQGKGNDGRFKRIGFNIALDDAGMGSTEIRLPQGKTWAPKFVVATLAFNNSRITLYTSSADNGMTMLGALSSPVALRAQLVFADSDLITQEDQKVIVVYETILGATPGGFSTGNLRVIEYDSANSEPLNAR